MVQGKQVICTLLVIFMKTQCIILENTSFSLVPGGHRILILGADRVNLIPHFFADIDFNSHKLQTVTLSTSQKDEGESWSRPSLKVKAGRYWSASSTLWAFQDFERGKVSWNSVVKAVKSLLIGSIKTTKKNRLISICKNLFNLGSKINWQKNITEIKHKNL